MLDQLKRASRAAATPEPSRTGGVCRPAEQPAASYGAVVDGEVDSLGAGGAASVAQASSSQPSRKRRQQQEAQAVGDAGSGAEGSRAGKKRLRLTGWIVTLPSGQMARLEIGDKIYTGGPREVRDGAVRDLTMLEVKAGLEPTHMAASQLTAAEVEMAEAAGSLRQLSHQLQRAAAVARGRGGNGFGVYLCSGSTDRYTSKIQRTGLFGAAGKEPVRLGTGSLEDMLSAYDAASLAVENIYSLCGFTIKPFVRNTEIEQAYFAAGSYPLAPTLAAPWRDIPTCVKAVEAVVAAFKASPARKEWEAAAVQHQRQRRR
ncbi:SAM-dependent methyltransferase [Chlorella sorokiniana]|uniref:SAM-dependent methyltransferase n=1 Tax=Chlorella sorokiniana TaxID=3076 RepID=A0A2P6TTW8_CHLSO|nr:SAM-dependent methyltransferase [Chlorella sorokiniana]|eukprot:PRW57510.1 SAM-dependent methyltransferase [Chlorella sorokiniana]